MAIFVYKAMDSYGKVSRGKITAANDIDLESKLKGLGLDLISGRAVKESNLLNFARVRIKDKIMFCVHLEQLDRAGVPILDALSDVRDSTESAGLKDIAADLYESVKSGMLLSEALAKHPRTFDNVYTGLVAAGEKTGNLHESFNNLGHHLKWNAEIRRKAKKAIYTPIFTLLIMMASVGILMTQVVPQLEIFLKNQGQEMPGHTKALIWLSNFVSDYWYLFLILPVLFVVFVKAMKKMSANFAYSWDYFMLHVPFIGAPMKKIDMARFTRFFGILYTSGIDILECLKISQQVVKNKVILDSVATVRRIVSEGNSLTSALRMTGQFPSLVVRMFKVGEDSGNMKDALENINFFYDKEVNDAVDSIIGVIKPALTILLGGMLAWIAAAVFGPIYDTIGKIQF